MKTIDYAIAAVCALFGAAMVARGVLHLPDIVETGFFGLLAVLVITKLAQALAASRQTDLDRQDREKASHHATAPPNPPQSRSQHKESSSMNFPNLPKQSNAMLSSLIFGIIVGLLVAYAGLAGADAIMIVVSQTYGNPIWDAVPSALIFLGLLGVAMLLCLIWLRQVCWSHTDATDETIAPE